jgi:hypothetical protein
VTNALQHSKELDDMFKFIKSKYKGDLNFDEHKVCILITELIWGRGYLPDKDHDILNFIKEYQENLFAMKDSLYEEKQFKGNIINVVLFIFRIIGDGRKQQWWINGRRRYFYA